MGTQDIGVYRVYSITRVNMGTRCIGVYNIALIYEGVYMETAMNYLPTIFEGVIVIKILVELLELLLVLTTSREQPCCWLCILYLFCYSAIKQVSAYSSNN